MLSLHCGRYKFSGSEIYNAFISDLCERMHNYIKKKRIAARLTAFTMTAFYI